MADVELETKYNKATFPGAFSGADRFYRGQKVESRRKVKKFLQSQDAYTLHQPARRNFPRNRVLVGGIGHQFDSDLLSFQNLSDDNDGYKYVITAVDVLSKYAYCEKLKTKQAGEVVSAFRKILKRASGEGRLCFRIRTDMGSEYLSAQWRKLMREFGLHHFVTYNTEIKANYAEIFQKTLKKMIYRALTARKTRRWIDLLPQVLENYNNSYHSTIRTTPASVKKGGELEEAVWRRQYELKKPHKPDGAFKFDVGDTVRLSHVAKAFTREFHERFTRELFLVATRKKRGGLNVYSVTDLAKDEVMGHFYQPELVKVSTDVEGGTFDVEKVLRSKTVKGRKMHLVRWLGYPPSFDSWVYDEDML